MKKMSHKTIQASIKELEEIRNDLRDKFHNIDDQIRLMRKLCEHDMECTGHDSHKDHYECKYCGYKEYY